MLEDLPHAALQGIDIDDDIDADVKSVRDAKSVSVSNADNDKNLLYLFKSILKIFTFVKRK